MTTVLVPSVMNHSQTVAAAAGMHNLPIHTFYSSRLLFWIVFFKSCVTPDKMLSTVAMGQTSFIVVFRHKEKHTQV